MGERCIGVDPLRGFTPYGLHGFLERDFDLDGWVDERPLLAARELLDSRG